MVNKEIVMLRTVSAEAVAKAFLGAPMIRFPINLYSLECAYTYYMKPEEKAAIAHRIYDEFHYNEEVIH